MKTELVVTNFPNDDYDVLIEHKGDKVIKVTDYEGNTLTLTAEQKQFVLNEIGAVKKEESVT